MPGFDAIGRLSLGQLPEATGAQPVNFVANNWQTPARKKLAVAVIATSFIGFVPPPQAQAAKAFTKFSEPVKRQKKIVAGFTNAPILRFAQPYVFARFDQPVIKRRPTVDEQPSPLFEIKPPEPPPFTGFASFSTILRARFTIAGFNLEPPTLIPPADRHDGGYVKKRKKSAAKPYDAAKEEQEVRRKRRQAIEWAIYGPPVEYSLPDLVLPARPSAPSDVTDLTSAVMTARSRMEQERRLAELRADDDDIEAILKDLL